jgi:hypothetical protein
MSATHNLLINLRNKLYAHRDALDFKPFAFHSSVVVARINCKFISTKTAILHVTHSHSSERYPGNLPKVIELCHLQNERADAEIKKLLKIITNDKKYSAGTYTVGVDFP